MDEHYCLYALTRANGSAAIIGPGVDPRFPVELIRCGQLAALTSRVGLDQFDPAKLQEGTADVPWLTKVAVRHNEIIAAMARHLPVLPMRLGLLFASRSSLIAKLAPYEAGAVAFLQHLEDREEWAVKIYVDEDRAERAILGNPAPPRSCAPLADYLRTRPYGTVNPPHVKVNVSDATKASDHVGHCTERNEPQLIRPARARGGTQYLLAKGQQAEHRRQVQTTIRQAVLTVEARLKGFTDSWRRLCPLPATLTNRREKMVWNGAFLLSRSTLPTFHAARERLGTELAPKGLLVEVTGPWPPYHFCPSFEPQTEDSPCRCTY
ncbi:MAG: GvpL/GvpF family gas vesicle protein [Thermoguttaceae bacterium]